VKRFASVSFDGVLAVGERDTATRTLASCGLIVTSWGATTRRTYASVASEGTCERERAARELAARIDEPPLVVLRVVPRFADRLPPLAYAFEGAGAPPGVRAAYRDDDAVVVEFDARQTSPRLVLALVDLETGGEHMRKMVPLVTLDDATLATFASVALREPDLDAARLIETYLEPLLAGDER